MLGGDINKYKKKYKYFHYRILKVLIIMLCEA